jgi:dTDP-4-dehydrorhamnose 3,5-epimerase
MIVEKTPLSGLLVIQPDVFEDNRGFFYESYNENKFRDIGVSEVFRQDNHSRSVQGTLRGLHFQMKPGQAKLVRAIRGAVWDVAVDIRPSSPTCGKWFAVELSERNRTMFYIPAGFAHGFCVLSETAEFVYKCSSVYDGKTESGIAWNDPEIAVKWPLDNPVLSARDQQNQSFRDYLKKVEADHDLVNWK